MKLSEILHKDAIVNELQSKDKQGVLKELSQAAAKVSQATHDEILGVLEERESLGSTGIGGGIAIPHGKLPDMDSVILGLGISRTGVEYDSLDNKPVHIFFVILTPEDSTGGHLKVLAQVSKLLKQEQFKTDLLQTRTSEDIFDIICQQDEEF